MHRTSRLFDLIQTLRTERKAITTDQLAARLEVLSRTIYRDVQTHQSIRISIDGEAGIGYLMREGYDLPALNFSPEEIEAIGIGLSLVEQTGDRALCRAAFQVTEKMIGAEQETQLSTCRIAVFFIRNQSTQRVSD
ncbi:MAG: putative DNA-binding transcriptional regulator YafY [Gammaproteobacteria bacterium]|jgi:predicted DNA-binding transcriptional regulator YafY